MIASATDLPPIYRLGGEPMTDTPAHLVDYYRATMDSYDELTEALRPHGLRPGELLDRLGLAQMAEEEALSELNLDFGARPPHSDVAKRYLSELSCRGFEVAQLDALFGFPSGCSAAWFAKQAPPRHGRAVFRRHQAGQTMLAMARALNTSERTVRSILDLLGLEPNEPADRVLARELRPKIVALAKEQIRATGEPVRRLIIDSLTRQGYEVTPDMVKHAIADARKRGELPPARQHHGHGRL